MTDVLSNAFDLIVIAIILFSGFCGLLRGVTKEVLSLIRWIIPLVLAFYGYSLLGEYQTNYLWEDPVFIDFASGAIIFIVTFLALTWFRSGMSGSVKGGPLNPIDKIFGLAFGFLRGFVLICLAYIVYEFMIPAEEDRHESLKSSFSYTYIKEGSNFLRNSVSFAKETKLPELET